MPKILVIIKSFNLNNHNENNFFKINNIPLSILKYQELKKSQYFNNFKIIIATDDKKVLPTFLKYGLITPLIISDFNKIDIIKYVLEWYKERTDEKFNYLIYLPSKYLFLDISDIDKMISNFLKNKNHYDSLQTFENLNFQKLNNIYRIENNLGIKLNINLEDNSKYCVLNNCMTIYKINIVNMEIIHSNNILPYYVKDILKLYGITSFNKNLNLITKYYLKLEKFIKIKILSNKHPKSDIGYFGFDCKILDNYLNSKNWIESNTFSCNSKDKKDSFDVVVWRKEIDEISSAHGRHINKNLKMKFNIGDELYLKYNDCSFYNIIKDFKYHSIFTTNILSLFENKSIIICGNGNTGYEENKSNIYIDSHDIVIRVNSYKKISNICGNKTTFHFMNSLNTNFHSENDPIFPVCNDCEYILINDESAYLKKLKKLKEIRKPLVLYNTKLIDRIMLKLFNTKIRMTGSIILIIAILIKMNVNCEINYIGFSDGHNLVKNNQIYYWGNRLITDNKYVKLHNSHNFDKQYKLLNIITYLI
jgi:hypothetical protein